MMLHNINTTEAIILGILVGLLLAVMSVLITSVIGRKK